MLLIWNKAGGGRVPSIQGMDLASLIETHGYWVLVVGCLLEGEAVLVLAGLAAHSGHMNPFAVVAIAAAAGFAGDQFYFWLGRRHGNAVIRRWPSVVAHSDRLQRMIFRYHEALIVGIRFAYGLRIAGPVLIGMSTVSSRRFALFNALGAVIWACVVPGVGWVLGHAAQSLLAQARSWEAWILLGLAAVAALAWWLASRKKRAR